MGKQEVLIIGAGFVGICIALTLRRQGYPVKIVDRGLPGGETSSGNAGVICSSGIHPLADPSLVKQSPKLLSNSDTRLLIRANQFLPLVPWLTRFALNCNQRRFRTDTDDIAKLTAGSLERHLELMQQAGAKHLLQETGWLRLYRTPQSFSAAKTLSSSLEHYQVPFRALQPNQIKELEPDLGVHYAGALWMTETHSLSDPAQLAHKYFDLAISEGVIFEQCDVNELIPSGDQWIVKYSDRSRAIFQSGHSPWCLVQ